MGQNIAVSVKDLCKSFRIPHENRNTLRERLMHFRKKTTYETFPALDGISFDIRKGEFFSIIGRNGSGKSTLLKILAGIYTADSGTVTVNGEISPFLELGVGFNPELSGKDNIYLNSTILGLSRRNIDRKFRSIVEFSELEQFIDMKLKNYSSGMQVRLAFATAIQSNRDILLMDEVLAVGDARFQIKCYQVFETIIRSGRTIVFVSHDPHVVQKYSDRVLYLEDSRMAFIGEPEKALSMYMYSDAVRAGETSAVADNSLFTADGLRDEDELQSPSGSSPEVTSPVETGKPVEIGEVTFFDKDGQAVNILHHGETFRIRVLFRVHTPVTGPVFNLSVTDQMRQVLFTSSTLAENTDTGTLEPGTITVEYELPNYFSQGKYSVTPMVCDQTLKIIFDNREDAASFQVYQSNPLKPASGMDIPHTITIS